jgi:hypothetical protein
MNNWIDIEHKPEDFYTGTYIVRASSGNVAPMVRGVVQNNTGAKGDWSWGDKMTHFMPLPSPDTSTVTISREVYDGLAQMLTQDIQDGVEFNSWALPIVGQFLEAGGK